MKNSFLPHNLWSESYRTEHIIHTASCTIFFHPSSSYIDKQSTAREKEVMIMDTPNRKDACFFNLLKATGHVMHHQFNIQQLYALPTLYLCVLYLSENKQRLVPLTA